MSQHRDSSLYHPLYVAAISSLLPQSCRLSSDNSIQGSDTENVLNFTQMELFSLDDLGSIFVSILTVCRAFAGKRARNIRAVFALGEKGLKAVLTSVRNRVIMISIDVRLFGIDISKTY